MSFAAFCKKEGFQIHEIPSADFDFVKIPGGNYMLRHERDVAYKLYIAWQYKYNPAFWSVTLP